MVFQQVIMIQLLHSFDTLLAGQRRKILYRSAFECPWIQSPSALSQIRPLANRPSANEAARQSALGQTDSSLRIPPYNKVHGTPTVVCRTPTSKLFHLGGQEQVFFKKDSFKMEQFYTKGPPQEKVLQKNSLHQLTSNSFYFLWIKY